MTLKIGEKVVVQSQHLQQLFDTLTQRDYRVIGPTIRDSAIVYQELSSTAELPENWTDEQSNGTYRLKKRKDKALFGYVVGPHSWKKYLYPPSRKLWHATPDFSEIKEAEEEPPKYAFIGVRACELNAIAIQDKVFIQGPYPDPAYKAIREQVFIVAVNCTKAGGNCFCVSMQTGPEVAGCFDLAMTEVSKGTEHYFVVEVGSESGAEVLDKLYYSPPVASEIETAHKLVEDVAKHMDRKVETKGLKELLYRNNEDPRWDEVAERCLSCGNCTMVCPTCFCSKVEDLTDLDGSTAERWRRWDSCFTVDFSYIKGGTIRPSVKSRYRQWLTHKFATWQDQFGTFGCTGCGRCITWCPVGIDLTEEARAIAQSDSLRAESAGRNV